MNHQRLLVLCALVATGFLSPCLYAADDYTHYTSVGQLGMTVTNFGCDRVTATTLRGSRPVFTSSTPIWILSRVEHFSYGGLWIGGIVDGVYRVSTAVMDGTFGGEGWEWNNAGPAAVEGNTAYSIVERSSLQSSAFYDTLAISHQDFLMSFTDTSLTVPGADEVITNHTPMGLQVDLMSPRLELLLRRCFRDSRSDGHQYQPLHR